MSLALPPAAKLEADPALPPRSERGEFTWELAMLFPRQGEWTEEEYLSREFQGLVEFVGGTLEFLDRIPEDEGGPPPSEHGDWTWEVLAAYPRQGKWKEASYLGLETNLLIEFSDGVLEFLPIVTPFHQDLVQYIRDQLERATQARYPGRVYVAPLRIRLRNGRFREPDVIFAKPEHIPDRHQPLIGAELIVEVVSGSAADRHRDFVSKRDDYAASRIREYWIVDPELETITVLVLRDNKDEYQPHGRFGRGERATSKRFPEFTIDVNECFAAGSDATS